MGQDIPLIRSYEELLQRPLYSPSLHFHPKASRRFGSVICPTDFADSAPCGIASCRTPHLHGYLITTSDGQETNIGSHCGKKHFGIEFTQERRRVDQALIRTRRIASIRELQAVLPTLIEQLDSLEADHKALVELKQRLMGAIGTDVFSVLKIRADRGDNVITRPRPMTKKEADIFFETSNRHPGDGLGWPTKDEPVATLEGLAYIKARAKDIILLNLVEPLRNLAQVKGVDLESMKSRELGMWSKLVGDLPVRIAQAQEVVLAGWRFFTPTNVGSLTFIGADAKTLKPMIQALEQDAKVRG